MIHIKLQNCCIFFFEVYFEAPKMYTNQLNNICNEVAIELQYLQLYQRYASLQVLFKIFAQICSVVICKEIFEISQNFCFPDNLLVAAANRFKVQKTLISLKVTVYI